MTTVMLCWCVGSFALAPLVGRALRKPPSALAAGGETCPCGDAASADLLPALQAPGLQVGGLQVGARLA